MPRPPSLRRPRRPPPTPRRLGRLAPLAVAAVAAASGCLHGTVPVTAPGPAPPPAEVRGSLSIAATAAASAAASSGPLAVVFGGPSGETTQATEATLVFNKSMRKLGLSPHDPPPPVTMTPRVPGSWDWVGSKALRFTAAAPLPGATTFRVEVPRGTQALDGSALSEAYALVFSTPRPTLKWSDPEAGQDHATPKRLIDLAFSQPVADAEVARAVSLTVRGTGASLPFTVRHNPLRPDPSQVELTPRSPLPTAAEIVVRVDPSFRAQEGPLPMGKAAEVSFRTIDPPKVLAIGCEKIDPTRSDADDAAPDDDAPRALLSTCPPGSPFTLRFNNGVNGAALASAITVEPTVKLDFSDYPWTSDTPRAELELQGDFQPGKTYRVSIHPAAAKQPILDDDDQPLTDNFQQTIRVSDFAPELRFVGSGVYWVPRGPQVLPVDLVNVNGVAVTATLKTREQVLASLEGGKEPAPPLGAKRFSPPDPPHNQSTRAQLRLDDLLRAPVNDGGLPGKPGSAPIPPVPRGPVLLQATYRAGREARSTARELQVTDLGVDAKVSPDQAVLWVTRFNTGAPVDKAEIAVHRLIDRRKPGAEALGSPPPVTAVTDAAGNAALPLGGLLAGAGPDARFVAFVRSGDDWTYQTFGAPAEAPAVGSIFTERGLYRPGESVGIKGIFRLPRAPGLTTPTGRTVTVKVTTNDPETLFATWTTTLSRFGTFDRTLPLPRSAPVGYYGIEADLGGSIAHDHFEVREYRPTEIAVEVNADRAAYIRGDTLTCTVQGRYLHGGAMSGAGCNLNAIRRNTSFVPPGLDGFVVGEPTTGFHGRPFADDGDKLDRQGRFSLHKKLDMPGQEGPETVTCNTMVEDLNREALTASTTALVHPGEVYLGLVAPTSHEIKPGAVLRPGLVAADPQGIRRSIKAQIELLMHRIVVDSRGDETATDTSLGTCDVTTGAAPASCPLPVPTTPTKGPYGDRDTLIVRASAQDHRGNLIASSYSLRPTERKRPPPPPPPPAGAPDFEISLDRESFEVGQTAALRLRSPFKGPATAWITVERESVIESRQVTVNGPEATLDVPITTAMIPNGVLALTLIQGTAVRHDKVGFNVDPAPRALAVRLHPSTMQAAPGDSLDVDVEVRDASGAPARAEVTLFAADEGTLSLIRYRTPNPLQEMFERRALRINSTEARDDVFLPGLGRHRLKPPQVRMGATSVNAPRFDFRQTVLFEPRLVTDAAGHVHHRVKLPDGLTTYRFMAVAVAEEDRFGSAEAPVTTSKPLMARATIPRAIRAGDRFEASVVIATRDLPPADVELIADVQGLTPIELPRRTLFLAPGEPVEVRFPLRADRPGKVALTFRAAVRSKKGAVLARDAVSLSGEVTLPIVAEAVALSGETRAAVAEQLGDLTAIRGDFGGLELQLSRTPLAGLAAGIEQLLDYPYGCTEQTVSRMIPLLSLRDLARPLGVKLPDDLPGALAAAAQKLTNNQRSDGGFGLWPESRASEPWISAYAVWGLEEASRRGVAVKASALDRAMGYLKKTLTALDTPSSSAAAKRRPRSDVELAEAAFTLDALADAGEKDAARTSALFQQRDRLPLFGRALLLHTLAISGGDVGQIAELRRDVEASLRIDGPVARATPSGDHAYAPLLDSEVRTSALTLRALLALDPAHPLATRLALGLLADRHGGTWRSTQETAWALLSLDALRRAQPSETPNFDARVFLGGAMLTEAAFHGADAPPSVALTVPITRLVERSGAALTFAVQGTGELHYEARLRFARKALPDEPTDGGFFVQKTLRTEAAAPGSEPAKARAAGRFGPGDLVLCEVVVVTPSPRHYVVIDDPLPGGFEAVDGGLRGGTDEQLELERGFASRRELRDDRVLYFIDHMPAGIYRYRYLARATTLGTFVLPPTRAEEMYVPETFGATAAQAVRIGER